MRLRQPRFMPPNASALVIALLVALTGCGPSSADDDDSIPTDDDDSTQGDDDDSAQSHSQSWSLSFPREALERVSLTNSVGQLSLSGSPGATEVSVQLVVYSNAPLDLGPFLREPLNQVVGEGIVVIDHQKEHFSRRSLLSGRSRVDVSPAPLPA